MGYNRKKITLPSTSSTNFLDRVKEVIELREGARSGQDNSMVTFGDLARMSLGGVSSDDANDAGVVVIGNGNSPDPPTDLSVTTNFLGNELSWTASGSNDVWYYEVWVSTTQSRSAATLLGTVPHPRTTYYHSIKATDATNNHYYWVRAKSWSGLYSEWEPNDDQGGYLASGNPSLSEVTKETLESLKLSQKSVLNVAGEIDGVGSYVGGVTDGGETTQDFVILADTFRILQPDQGHEVPRQPFVVGRVDGEATVGIDGALVVDGSILANSIAADSIKAVHLDANEAFVNTIQSAGYDGVSSGWKLDHVNNTAKFYDITLTIAAGSGIANLSDAGSLATKNSADYGSDVSGTKPPTNADNTSTVIGAGFVTTGWIADSSIIPTLKIDFDNAEILVNKAAGLKVDSGTIAIYDSGTQIGELGEFSSLFRLKSINSKILSLWSAQDLVLSANYTDRVLICDNNGGNTILNINRSEIEPREHIIPWSSYSYVCGSTSSMWSDVCSDEFWMKNSKNITSNSTEYMHFRNGSTYMAAMRDDGRLYIAGSLYQNHSFSLDLATLDKWYLFDGLVQAFQNHDESLAPPELRYRFDEEDELGETGVYTYHSKPKDYLQILFECLHEVRQDMEALKNG